MPVAGGDDNMTQEGSTRKSGGLSRRGCSEPVERRTIVLVSGDWGRPHFRRRVASELGVTLEVLDRALAGLETSEHRADGSYRALSQNDRLKELAQALDVPLSRLVAVDGISSLVPARRTEPVRRSKRPPAKKRAGSSSGTRSRGAARPVRRPKPKATKVPMKKFPWELDPEPAPRPKPQPERTGGTCRACGLPFNPLTGTCGCS